MARLSDLPHVWRTLGPIGFVKRVFRETLEDYVFTWAASLAYSWMFAVFPFLIFLLALLPYLPEVTKNDAAGHVKTLFAQVFTPEASRVVSQELDNLVDSPRAGILSITILVVLYSASGGIAATMAALDRAYDIEVPRSYVQTRGMALLVTISVALIVLTLIALMPVGTSILNWADERGLIPDWARFAINLVRYTMSVVLMFTILSIVYYLGPSVRGTWRWITPGSLFVVVVWVLLGFAFRFYIERFGAASYARTYGAIGGVAILLLVFYVDAIVLLVGAEINSEVDFAVLGVTSSTAPSAHKTPPRADLDAADLRMLAQLKRRRPSLTIFDHAPAATGVAPHPLLADQEKQKAADEAEKAELAADWAKRHGKDKPDNA
jgi:membrane protein